MQHNIQTVFLRRNDLKSEYNITRHTSYILESTDPTFPKRREIAPGVTGWLRLELDAWAVLTCPTNRVQS